ncbi:3-keto-steroid reductase [Yarrowia sp. B02]|nr:3-keto-steroid reductase [Yarrowia sp. B02]
MVHNRKTQTVVITGASSNLGIAMGKRLIDEKKEDAHLTIVVTSRTLRNVRVAIKTLKAHAVAKEVGPQVDFDYLLFDLADMTSINGALVELKLRFTRIDTLIFNSNAGHYIGINWPLAMWRFTTQFKSEIENPSCMIQAVGVKSSDGMGSAYQSNVFGPWYMVQELTEQLKNGGKVIWISSITSSERYVDLEDIELIHNKEPYKGSKRLIDVAHNYYSPKLEEEHKIYSYLTDPGIFTSSSASEYLNIFTAFGMYLMFYVARLIGLTTMNIDPYKAANVPVWVTTSDNPAALKRDYRLGSRTGRWGDEMMDATKLQYEGSEEVGAYIDKGIEEWREKLKEQIN